MPHATVRTSFSPVLVLMLVLAAGPGVQRLEAQTSDLRVLVSRSYTTQARIFPNPTALSSTVRNQNTIVEGLTGFSGEVQIPLAGSEFSVGLSIEYLSYIEEGRKPIVLGGIARELQVRDGFSIVPIELRGIVTIPLQAETFRLTMAGGGGAYIADRILEVAGVGVRSTTTTIGYGIHISVAFAYQFLPGIWVHGETRFRDPDVTVEYVYDELTAEYNGAILPFPITPMQARINVDGMSLAAGIMMEIPGIFGR